MASPPSDLHRLRQHPRHRASGTEADAPLHLQ